MSIEKFIKKVCVQDAILWYDKVADGFGKLVYTSVKGIKVRWDDKTEIKIGSDGKEFVSRAQILVTEDIPMEAMIKLGVLEDLMEGEEGDPAQILDPYAQGAIEVKVFEKIPMIKSTTDFVRKVFL